MISLITSFQVLGYIYVMTQGNPAYETLALSYYIYQIGFQYFRMGSRPRRSPTFSSRWSFS